MRILAVVPLLVALALPAPAAASNSGAEPRGDLVSALGVLHAWDASRADAWSHDDVAALRSLYVHGSSAGRADVRLMRSYQARGFVVRRLVTQVFAASVLRRDPSVLQLRVFDRVAGGEIVHDRHGVSLRSTPPAVRTLQLRRVSGRWLVESVSD